MTFKKEAVSKLNDAVSTIEGGEICFRSYSEVDLSHTCRPQTHVRDDDEFLRQPHLFDYGIQH